MRKKTIAEMTMLELIKDLKPSNISDYRRELLKRTADLDQVTACAVSVIAAEGLERSVMTGADYRSLLTRIRDLIQPCLNRNKRSSDKSECASRCTIGAQEASEGLDGTLGSSEEIGGDSGVSGEVGEMSVVTLDEIRKRGLHGAAVDKDFVKHLVLSALSRSPGGRLAHSVLTKKHVKRFPAKLVRKCLADLIDNGVLSVFKVPTAGRFRLEYELKSGRSEAQP